MDDKSAARDASRLAAVEAQVAQLLARIAAQDREIALLNATIEEMGPVNLRLGNLHARLDDLEAVAHRHEDDSVEQGDEDDDTDDETDEDDDE